MARKTKIIEFSCYRLPRENFFILRYNFALFPRLLWIKDRYKVLASFKNINPFSISIFKFVRLGFRKQTMVFKTKRIFVQWVTTNCVNKVGRKTVEILDTSTR